MPDSTPMTHDELVASLWDGAHQLRNFWAQDNGTSVHLVAADQLDAAADTIEQMREEIAGLREALEGLRKPVQEATWFLRAQGGQEFAAALADAFNATRPALPPIAETKE